MGKGIFKKISSCLEYFIDIVFPKPQLCNSCGRELKEVNKYRICRLCNERIIRYLNSSIMDEIIQSNQDFKTFAFDDVFSCCVYDGLVRTLIHRCKYKDKREIAITIAGFMDEVISTNFTRIQYDFIVPVPISGSKLKKRGYNHAELIAAELQGFIGIPSSNCMRRIKDTQPQVLFNGHDRWYNVEGCFECNEDLSGKNILLVDDIITTGATAHFCAKELKKAGATYVTVLSFAKSHLH